MHDMMQPIFIKADQARDAVREMREQVNQHRATIEDLSMGQMRLQRYDEYFMDSNKKLNSIELNFKMQDKRITDEVSSLAAHKDKLLNKIACFDMDLIKFKDQMAEREQNTFQLLGEVDKVKDEVKEDMLQHVREFQEEIIVQNERLQELGQQIYSNRLHTERKFIENADFDIKIRTNQTIMFDIQSQLMTLSDKFTEFQQTWVEETDIHLKKYVPLQMAGMIYDTVHSTLPHSKDQQLLKDKYSQIFDALESAVRSLNQKPADLNDYVFEKMGYRIPATFL